MVKQTILVAACILAIAAAVVWIYRNRSDAPQNFDVGPYHALGARAAEETAKLLGKKGEVLVVAPDTSEFANSAVEAQLSGFQQTLRKTGLTSGSPVRFKLTPQDRMVTGGAMPTDQFLHALQSNPKAGAVVLFCAFPALASADYEALKKSGAKFVAVSGYLPGYRQLLQDQVLQVAIVPRPGGASPDGSSNGQKSADQFDSQFIVLTADKPADWP